MNFVCRLGPQAWSFYFPGARLHVYVMSHNNSASEHPPFQAFTASKTTAESNSFSLPPGLDSGDVVLFNRRCTSMPFTGAALCVVAKLFSNSQWDHVGVIIRHPATGELLFLEADFGGVKLRPLETRVQRSKSNEIAVRRLSVLRTASMRENFYAFAQEMLGRPYEIGTGSVLARVTDPLAKQEKERLNALLLDKRAQVDEITRELDTTALTTFQRRLLQSERDRVLESCHQIYQRLVKELGVSSPLEKRGSESLAPHALAQAPTSMPDLSRVFCSELVAAAYQRVGLLGAYPPPFYYSPKDFSSQQTHPPGLHLLKSARLSKEHYIRQLSRLPRESGTNSKTIFRDVSDGDMPSRDARKSIRDAVKRTPIYSLVPDEYKRNHLLKSFRARVIEPGDVVFEQGQYGDQFFVVDTGVVERFMQKGDEDPILVNTMGPRSTFGLTAFTFNTPRVSTVRAKERTLLWVLDRPTFELFRDASSDVKSILSAVDHRRLRQLLQDHFLFKRLDKIGYEQVSAFFLVKFRAGETVFKQGDPGDNFYFIKNGELERHIWHPRRAQSGDGPFGYGRGENDEDTLVKTFKPGQSFGELSLMYDAPRGSTVRARTDTECWAISAESFHRLNLSGGTQHLRAVFNKNASVVRDGEAYMTRNDLLRFAGIDAFPDVDRERLATLLVALVTSNRQRDPASKRNVIRKTTPNKESLKAEVSENTETSRKNSIEDEEDVLMDFWEFVRFDIVLNQPSAEMAFAFRLADQNNSGFISLDEMENLLQSYAHIDDTAQDMLSGKSPRLRRVFGRHGSRTLSAREFHDLSDNILPPLFVKDVKKLTHHMLNMDVVGGNLSREHDKDEIAFMEPEGGLSMIGSNFMNSSAKNRFMRHPEALGYSSYNEKVLPRWMTAMDWGHLISVGVSGAVSRSAVAPLERLKILMQTNGLRYHALGWASSLRSMINQDHNVIRALFRGNGANVIRIIPSAAIQLVMVDQLREMHIIRKLMNKEKWPSGSASSITPGPGGDQVVSGSVRTRAVEAVLIGGVAGMVAATATYPIDFVRGRLSVQRKGFEPYYGTMHGIRTAARAEGVRSLYRGLGPSLAGVFPYVGLSFGIYETLRPILPKKNDMSGIPTTGSSIVCGMVAMATGQLASFPLDTCRRRMQVAGFDMGTQVRAKSFVETWREIGSQMGWRGYFRGVMPNLLKIAPASAVSFVAYEHVRGGMKSAESTAKSYTK